ncbi:DUF927 domain-containing protein [Geomonas sp. RF6]|uniref:DUF927 domain-containing protein n=1 Tax=Geomonas sp. RF6 TaxID=2897342 RepID=UPI001E29E083|nr:DUF927 domain-containing protein [Geomonas sp. RF6]UFS71773.1 DUF927 domain-containing protein [Geomonas sp. RF6]
MNGEGMKYTEGQAASVGNPQQDSANFRDTSNAGQQSENGEFQGEVIKAILGKNEFAINGEGVYWAEISGTQIKPEMLVCAPLRVVADSRDDNSQNWGRILEFEDRDGNQQRYHMQMSDLRRDGEAIVDALLSKGLSMVPGKKARLRLIDYIQNSKPIKNNRVLTTDKTGWYGTRFVLPDEVIGAGEEDVMCISSTASANPLVSRGSLDDWKRDVALLCKGNSRLLFAVSCAFASPMLYALGEESGGFNFVGGSSTGKSTALHVAASVYGKPDRYTQNWRSTSNGLEGIAKAHNDTLLILDELGQVQPKDAGEISYMLANGAGKQRANIKGEARQKATWRLLFLSSGEITLADHMVEGGKKARAGQEIRLADIPADAGCNMGIFENLNDIDTPAALAELLKRNAAERHGTAFRAFIEKVIEDYDQVIQDVKVYRDDFIKENALQDASGQVNRLLNRFALVAAAGEMATALEITGWELGDASRASAQCFKGLLEKRGGTGMQEEAALFSQVRAFFELHGESRFTPREKGTGVPDTHKVTHNRAGFIIKNGDGNTEYLVLPEAFTEICSGFDKKWAAKVLVERGLILPGNDGKNQRSVRLAGIGTKKIYHFTAKAIADE